ncbi:hypothetical protein Pelo_10069 [Pelomyxa schiedti]|nr:hypothetical protein Pelo_10069 [Pelomyxa schiedti]
MLFCLDQSDSEGLLAVMLTAGCGLLKEQYKAGYTPGNIKSFVSLGGKTAPKENKESLALSLAQSYGPVFAIGTGKLDPQSTPGCCVLDWHWWKRQGCEGGHEGKLWQDTPRSLPSSCQS